MTTPTREIPTTYDHATTLEPTYQKWLAAGAFKALPDQRQNRYVIMMPLPNVTGALHMGHAMDNVMQDMLIRWHRMMGDNSLWMPGTDHAGIATQAIVEKRLLELEGKTRNDIGREELIRRIWEWKDKSEQRIILQQQRMGCSCDWDRHRFTMDAVCTAAVRETFFRMFRDGLIYRGNRMVNWDCQLQTAVSDDEIYHDLIDGHFWHLKYPIINPKPGEPEFVTVATTRPETMLGDTAVACHPNPTKALQRQIDKVKEKLKSAGQKERPTVEAELAQLEERVQTHLPRLEQFAAMARDGRKVLLPLQEREIPLITDEWARPELGSGCVKITPAHDPNDYNVWRTHNLAKVSANESKNLPEKSSQGYEFAIINILNPDGTLNANAGAYKGLDRFAARKKVVVDLQAKNLILQIEDRQIEIGHSDRSKSPIEPYLSKQWFVRMGDVPGGIVCGRGTANEFRAPGLAQAAIDAVRGDWKSPTGRKLTFYPDADRYGNTYCDWLAEKRDWCISRQLWWGHRIPIWRANCFGAAAQALLTEVSRFAYGEELWLVITDADGEILTPDAARNYAQQHSDADHPLEIMVCSRNLVTDEKYAAQLAQLGLIQDPDVLDTWFSSAIWPHSTLGFPDPQNAQVKPGQTPCGRIDGQPDALSYYYPGSCLVTGRDIITLWVARMQLTGLYNLGDVPFTDCFVHATILDGKGERMSKSKGNGIDPVDIIERYGVDALRYILCEMQTGTQEFRLPVQAISPFTGDFIDLATAKHGRTIFSYICPQSGKEFDVTGTMPELPSAKVVSERFDEGKNFCNKLWNASRFAMMNLTDQPFQPLTLNELDPEDRWILARLNNAISQVQRGLTTYNPSAAIGAARSFFWNELCDWYLELIKPRLRNNLAKASAQDGQEATEKPSQGSFVARQVLAAVLDQTLRLFHPFIPFITEAIWAELGQIMPTRGITEPFPASESLILAAWPEPQTAWADASLEADFELLQETIKGIRNVRGKYNVPPGKKLAAIIKIGGAAGATLQRLTGHLQSQAGLDSVIVTAAADKPKTAAAQVVRDFEIYVNGVLDPDMERKRLSEQRDKLLKFKESQQKKLANDSFVSKAPANVVEAERQKLRDTETQLAVIEESLRGLE